MSFVYRCVMIISVSRRTDIPAFHSEWLMNRLRAGYALVRNPVYRTLVHKIDLTRSNVDCLFFVSKDPRPLEPHLKEIASMGHVCVFNITMNPYGKDLEPFVPPRYEINDACIRIAEIIGRDRMAWRYDPVIFNSRQDIKYHTRKFSLFCKEASAWTDRCIFSFINMYGKLGQVAENGLIRKVSKQEMVDFAKMAGKVADDYGMSISNCCGDTDFSEYGISKRGCIDRGWMNSLNIPYESTDNRLREGCRCVRTIDIGEYDTCLHDCVYCYANRIDPSKRISKIYNPESELLWGELSKRDRIVALDSRCNGRLEDAAGLHFE